MPVEMVVAVPLGWTKLEVGATEGMELGPTVVDSSSSASVEVLVSAVVEGAADVLVLLTEVLVALGVCETSPPVTL